MQTILGAGGAIGKELARALRLYTQSVRLVGRNPQQVLEEDQLHPADLTDPGQTKAAVQGSDVAYLTVGLPYKTKIWAAQWPLIMKNVLAACVAHGWCSLTMCTVTVGPRGIRFGKTNASIRRARKERSAPEY